MKHLLFITTIFLAISCGPRRPGTQGVSGKDGMSLVTSTEVFQTEEGVFCSRVDIFQDVDRNNYFSAEDRYNNGFIVSNGERGEQGERGVPADLSTSVVDIIDPCGSQHPYGLDELILKLGNGKYLSSVSDDRYGNNTRLSFLSPGRYKTSDGTNCTFTLL